MNKSFLFGGRNVLVRLLSDKDHVKNLSDQTYIYGNNTLVLRRSSERAFDISLNGSEARRVTDTELIRHV